MSKPLLVHQPTTATLVQPAGQLITQSGEPPVEDPKSEQTSADRPGEKGEGPTPGSGPSTHDIIAFIVISIMLIWPWIFFGVVWVLNGIPMNNGVARVAQNNPHTTTYFVTFICNIISMIVGALLSLTIIRFAQESVTHKQPTKSFTLQVLKSFKEQSWPWGWRETFEHLLAKETWWLAVLLILCVCAFPQVTSSTTSLLTPAPFNRTAILTGTELDFSSTATDCLAWFEANPLSNTCGWQSYKGLQYTNCLGENQMVDVLEAGRGNILELITNNTQGLTFSQLGADDGLHFLGSIRGVLPIGPNGVPAFNTLSPSPFSKPETVAGMISYDYTLDLQGLTSNVTCSYAPTYPFDFISLDGAFGLVLGYNATCANHGGIEVLTNVNIIPTANGNNTLVYWACQSAPNGAPTSSYTIYLSGLFNYVPEIGNITCTVNPIQAAVFPVTYQSHARIFTAGKPTTASAIAFPALINYALLGLGEVISEGQNSQSNPVAESVFTFGVKSFGVLPQRNALYLRLFEQMIQGIIEYETTYIRLLYSTVPNPPSSCIRTVNGTTDYVVFGWFVTGANIGFLFPITIINLGALYALWRAMLVAKTGKYLARPLEDRPVTYNPPEDRERAPEEWKDKISFQPATIWKELFKSEVAPSHVIPAVGGAVKVP